MDEHPDGRHGLVERRACPVCGSRSGTGELVSLPFDAPPMSSYLTAFYGGRLDVSPLQGHRFELIGCECGLVYQRLVPDERYLEHLYGVAALADPDVLDRQRGLRVRQNYTHEVEQCVRHFGGEPSVVEVLDHGAGAGQWLDMAAAYGCRTSGSELTPEGRERLAERGHTAEDPRELPEGRYHFVNSEQVLEHLVEPAAALRAITAALRPGGVARLSVPNGSDIRRRLAVGDWTAPKGSADSLNPVAPLEHLNCFDPHSLRRLAESAGLEPFRYPLRESLEPMERLRFMLGAVRLRLRPQAATLQYFRKPDQ